MYYIIFKDGFNETCKQVFDTENQAAMYMNELLDYDAVIIETNIKY